VWQIAKGLYPFHMTRQLARRAGVTDFADSFGQKFAHGGCLDSARITAVREHRA